VGRSTIREALRLLASQNLIVTTRGITGGSFVAVPEVSDISANLEIGMALLTAVETVTVEQLMEVRYMLEVPAAGLAALRHDDNLHETLRASLYDPTTTAGPDTYAHNQQFHLSLLACVENPVMQVITAPIFRVIGTRFGREDAPLGFWPKVDKDHRILLDAVTSGDADGARDAMRQHLDHLGAAYRKMDRRLRH
jgi:DNA-binding FadR family transcriptional regulator